MATLNSSNIVNGNIVETTDILQLYDALTAGGGTTGVYNISISGSLTGSATTATTAATASSATNLVVANTSSGVYYPIVVDGTGTKPPKTISTFELSGSILNNITASRAITASFALNASAAVPSTVTVNTPSTTQTLKPFAGSGSFTGGILNVNMGTTFPNLSPSALGVDLFLTATAASNNEYVGISFAGVTLTFRSSDVASSNPFYYVGWCK